MKYEEFFRTTYNYSLKKKYLRNSIISKVRKRHLINSFDVSEVQGLTVLNIYFM